MDNAIESARLAAVEASHHAARIVRCYRDEGGWQSRSQLLQADYPAREMGRFLVCLQEATSRVEAVADALIMAKPDNRPVRFGGTVAATAHEVAVKFAHEVRGNITGPLEGAHGGDGICCLYWPHDDIDPDLLARCRPEIQRAMAATEIIDCEELFYAIKIESTKAAATPPVAASLSPSLNLTESSIVQALRENNATSPDRGIVGEKLAPLATGLESNAHFRTTLSGLAKRGIVLNQRGKGYFLPND